MFVLVDHSVEPRAVGLDLRDTKLVLFGSPAAGTPVMTAALIALDLPLKVLVWADSDRTKVCYTPPSELANRYGLSHDLAARFAGIDAITDELVQAAPGSGNDHHRRPRLQPRRVDTASWACGEQVQRLLPYSGRWHIPFCAHCGIPVSPAVDRRSQVSV